MRIRSASWTFSFGSSVRTASNYANFASSPGVIDRGRDRTPGETEEDDRCDHAAEPLTAIRRVQAGLRCGLAQRRIVKNRTHQILCIPFVVVRPLGSGCPVHGCFPQPQIRVSQKRLQVLAQQEPFQRVSTEWKGAVKVRVSCYRSRAVSPLPREAQLP